MIDWLSCVCKRRVDKARNGGDNEKNDVLKFPWRPSRAYSSWKFGETVFWMAEGCYPWQGAPFNVPSDGHTMSLGKTLNIKQVLFLLIVILLYSVWYTCSTKCTSKRDIIRGLYNYSIGHVCDSLFSLLITRQRQSI